MLLELAQACHGALRTTLSYRDHAGRASVRAIDPYRLVHTGMRWYLVARDVTKQQWRTFRADRVVNVRCTTEPADLTDPPDAAALVSSGIANVVYPVYTTIRLPLPLADALHKVPPTIGTHPPRRTRSDRGPDRRQQHRLPRHLPPQPGLTPHCAVPGRGTPGTPSTRPGPPDGQSLKATHATAALRHRRRR
nr:WYL domain-containing protein [Streptomyces sp. DH12]